MAAGHKQLVYFTVIGGLQFVGDIGLYALLLTLGVDIYWANLLSRGVMGLAGFFANRYITFKSTDSGFYESFLRFLVAWAATSTLSTLGIGAALALFTDGSYTTLEATVIKTVLEILIFLLAFLIQKFWIFRT